MRGPSRARKIRGSLYATPLLHQDFRLPDERVRLRPMADVLAGRRLTATDDPAEADLLLMNTCSVREKAQEKVFSLLGEWRALKARDPRSSSASAAASRARRARRSPPRAVRRSRLRPADAAPPAGDDRELRRTGRAQSSTSVFRRSRSSIICPRRAPRARARSSRSWKAAASTAASASCPTRAGRRSAAASTSVLTEVRALAARACAK